MSTAVREADLLHDRDELVSFCKENLPGRPDERRFDWLYLNNPFGAARVLIACDKTTGKTVGVASAFPRCFWVERQRMRVWVLGDFCIAEEARSLGPAMALIRTCMASLPPNELWYDFPSANMVAVYRRMGLPLVGKQIRYVKVLTIDPFSGGLGAFGASAVSLLGNWNLHRSRNDSAGLACSVHETSFGDEFTELDRRAASEQSIQGLRTAEFLNWRYRSDPSLEYRVLTARQGKNLAGYVIVKIQDAEATVTDLTAIDQEHTIPHLIAGLVGTLQPTVRRLNAPVMGGSALTQYFRLGGFIPRESTPVAFSGPYQPQNWLLMQGDRES
jgi:hypothetical protein